MKIYRKMLHVCVQKHALWVILQETGAIKNLIVPRCWTPNCRFVQLGVWEFGVSINHWNEDTLPDFKLYSSDLLQFNRSQLDHLQFLKVYSILSAILHINFENKDNFEKSNFFDCLPIHHTQKSKQYASTEGSAKRICAFFEGRQNFTIDRSHEF